MATTPFSLAAQPVGGALVVNGEDVTGRARAWTITGGHDEPTRLTIELTPGEGAIEGEGVVEVLVAGPAGDAVRALDPEVVRERAAPRLGYDGNAIATYLEVIAAMVDEAGAET